MKSMSERELKQKESVPLCVTALINEIFCIKIRHWINIMITSIVSGKSNGLFYPILRPKCSQVAKKVGVTNTILRQKQNQ